MLNGTKEAKSRVKKTLKVIGTQNFIQNAEEVLLISKIKLFACILLILLLIDRDN